MTASIDYHSLATATSRLNDDSASNMEKGTQPKWDFKTETLVDCQHKAEIWADSHDIRHLLQHPPVADPLQLRKHEVAKRIILLTLPNQDREYVRGSLTLNEIRGKLLAKYMPSMDAEAGKLWSRFSALRQAGRPMVEHVNECMTVKNQLTALGETVLENQSVDKLLNIGRELSYLQPMLVRAPIDDIVAGLTAGYCYHYQDRQHQHQHGNAGRGRYQRKNPARVSCTRSRSGRPGYGRGECWGRATGTMVLQLQSTRKSAGGLRQTTHSGPSVSQTASCTRPWLWTWPQQRQGAGRASGCCHQYG